MGPLKRDGARLLPGTAGLAGLTGLAASRAMSRRLAGQDGINSLPSPRFLEMSRRRVGIGVIQVVAVWRRHRLERLSARHHQS